MGLQTEQEHLANTPRTSACSTGGRKQWALIAVTAAGRATGKGWNGRKGSRLQPHTVVTERRHALKIANRQHQQ